MVYLRAFFKQSLATPNCMLCLHPSQRAIPLCLGCEQDLPWLNHRCQQCAEPLPEDSNDTAPQPQICGRCLRRPPAFDSTRVPLRYAFPVDRLIQRFKQRADIATLELLSRLFIQRLSAHNPWQALTRQRHQGDADLSISPHDRSHRDLGVAPIMLPQQLIPVPLHRNRLYQRGFNQSRELAHCLGRQLQIPVNDHACRRQLNTPHQQGLTAQQRRSNLRHAFRVDPQRLRQVADIDHIALVDDVMTTGSTVQVLAKQLRRAGAGRIDVWCLARTPVGRDSSQPASR